MKGINQNIARIGNFTSSNIYKLLTKNRKGDGLGAPGLEYIEEKNFERKLQRSLNDESNARPLSWGTLLESFAFEALGLEYKLSSTETIQHPTIKFWCGSQDGNKFDEGKTVIDIKAPMTLKSFCQLASCKDIGEVRENHKDGEKYYWQLVSNAILTDSKWGELIIYMPMLGDLPLIRNAAGIKLEDGEQKYYWIRAASDDELPYLVEGVKFKSLNVIRFGIPQADKDLLTAAVLEAGKLLITP